MAQVQVFATTSDIMFQSSDTAYSNARNVTGSQKISYPSLSVLYALQTFSSPTHSVYTSWIPFNTGASVPAFPILSAYLSLYVAGVYAAPAGSGIYAKYSPLTVQPTQGLAGTVMDTGADFGTRMASSGFTLNSYLGNELSNIFTPSNIHTGVGATTACWIYSARTATNQPEATGVSSGIIASSADGSFAPKLMVTYDTPPFFNVNPPTVVQGSYSRIGPNNPYATVFVYPGDTEGGNLTVQIRTAAQALLLQTTQAPNTNVGYAIAYNTAGLSNGDNTCFVDIIDNGPLQTQSSNFIIHVDTGAPSFVAASALSARFAAGAPVGMSFQVTDSVSTSSNELSYEIRTASGGAGTLLAAGSMTNNQIVNASFVDGTLTQGATNTRWLRVFDGAHNSNEISLGLYVNAPPTISAGPTIAYSGGATRASSNATPFYVNFTPQDSDYTGTLTYSVLLNGVQQASAACSPNGPVSVPLAYNLLSGQNTTVIVSVTDGYNQVNSGGTNAVLDTVAPTIAQQGGLGAWSSPATVASQTTYSMRFVPTDDQGGTITYKYFLVDAGNNEITLGAGTIGSGNLVSLSVTTDSLVNGSNSRYVRLTDQGLNALVYSTPIVANIVVQANLVLASPGTGSSATISALSVGAGLIPATSPSGSAALQLSSPANLVPAVPGTGSTATASIGAPSVVLPDPATGVAVASLVLSAPALMAPTGAGGSTATAFVAAPAALVPATVAAGATPTVSLAATPGPAPIAPTTAGAATATANLDATHIVGFLTIGATAGAATAAMDLGATPHVGGLGSVTVSGSALINLPLLLIDTPNTGFLIPSARSNGGSSATLSFLISGSPLFLSSPAGDSSGGATLKAGIARSLLLPVESRTQTQASPTLPLEMLEVAHFEATTNEEALVPRSRSAGFGTESRAQTSRSGSSPLGTMAQTVPPATPFGLEVLLPVVTATNIGTQVEVLNAPWAPGTTPVEFTGRQTATAQAPLEAIESMSSPAVGVNLEALHIALLQTANVPYEGLINLGASAQTRVESQAQRQQVVTMGIDSRMPLSSDQATVFEALQDPGGRARVPVEAKGYALTIGPNAFGNLVVRRGPAVGFLKVHRTQSKRRVLVASGHGQPITP